LQAVEHELLKIVVDVVRVTSHGRLDFEQKLDHHVRPWFIVVLPSSGTLPAEWRE